MCKYICSNSTSAASVLVLEHPVSIMAAGVYVHPHWGEVGGAGGTTNHFKSGPVVSL